MIKKKKKKKILRRKIQRKRTLRKKIQRKNQDRMKNQATSDFISAKSIQAARKSEYPMNLSLVKTEAILPA